MKNDISKLMIPLKYADKFKWSPELGSRLQSLRGKTTMRALAEKVSNQGITCSYQYIYKLEDGKAESVSCDLIVAICNALEIDFKSLFPGVYLDFSELLQKNAA